MTGERIVHGLLAGSLLLYPDPMAAVIGMPAAWGLAVAFAALWLASIVVPFIRHRL